MNNKTLPPPIAQIVITVLHDGRIEVGGFPTNFNAAMQMMSAGMSRVAQHFVNKARDGEVDEQLTLDNSRIIKPQIEVALNKLH